MPWEKSSQTRKSVRSNRTYRGFNVRVDLSQQKVAQGLDLCHGP